MVATTVSASLFSQTTEEIQQVYRVISPNYGKTIGVFGGSLSATHISKVCKEIWSEKLGLKVFTYGRGGAGFAIRPDNPENNTQVQALNADVCDIYVLWASTNDYTKKIALGDVNSTDSTTQAGGIRRTVEILQKKNPHALILFFTSLPMFKSTNTLDKFVEAQIEVCRSLHIPVLDQFTVCGFNQWNAPLYYVADLKHLQESGYKKIAEMQVPFLANPYR